MVTPTVSRQDAIAGRKLKSFLLSAGYFPTVTFGKHPDYAQGRYTYGRSPPKNRFVTVAGVNVIGGEPAVNNAWKLSGNHVWYQHAGAQQKTGAERLQKFFDLENARDENFFTQANELFTGGPPEGFYGPNTPSEYMNPWKSPEEAEGKNPMDVGVQSKRGALQEKEFFKRVYRIWQRNSGKESNSFLKTLNSQLKSDIQSALATGKTKGELFGSRKVTHGDVTPGSLMPEEQTLAISEKQGATQEPTIGLTQPIDTKYVTVAGNIFIDVSDMTISAGDHHGLGPKGIKTTASDLTKIDESNFASLQNDIYEHFQDRIGMFNEGIIRIRENALKKAGRKTVTPEEMRRAGFTKGQRYTDAKGDSRRALQFKNFQKKTLANASAGASGVGKLLMMEGGKKVVDDSATKFILHSLGTWNSHLGNYYHGLTVSHDPHVTSSIRFRQHAADHASRAYEYKKLRKKQDILVSYGYASLELLRRRNMLNTGNYIETVRKMKNIHHAARYMKGHKKVLLNGYQAINAKGGMSQGSKTKTITTDDGQEVKGGHGLGSVGIHIPTGWATIAVDKAIEFLSKDGGWRPDTQGKKSFTHPIHDRIENEERLAMKRGWGNPKAPVYWPSQLDFWATPYYGYALSYGLDDIGEGTF